MKPVPTATASGDDDDTSAPPTDAGPVEPVNPVTDGGTATTFVGTLDATPPVTFGGTPYCKYTVVMKSIDIEVSIIPGANGSNQIIGATVKNTMVEDTVKPCPNAPSPPSDQSFAFTTLTQLPTGYELAFSGAKANKPATKLTLDLTPQGSGWMATAHWLRTDQTGNLNWTVTSTITLGPK